MAITTCKVCGGAYETTEEDANIPLSCAGEKDRICNSCYLKKIWQDETLRKIFSDNNFKVLEYFRQISKIGTDEIWLAYVLKKS